MEHILDNPIYHALISGNSHLSIGKGPVRHFPPEISPFAGLRELDGLSFSLLAGMLPPERVVVTITAKEPVISGEWKIIHQSMILQMTGENAIQSAMFTHDIVPLLPGDVPQMLALTKMTNPGPFLEGTIEFGNYTGIFNGQQLVAMAGHRLHAGNYVEISAVCTHPDFAGRGYGGILTLYQAQQIMGEGNIPFLHVRADNEKAINLYKNLGFTIRCEMHLNVLQK